MSGNKNTKTGAQTVTSGDVPKTNTTVSAPTDNTQEDCGDPVDAITGAVFYNLIDFEYPGPIPLRWERNWNSVQTDNIGPFGHGSSLAYSSHILMDGDKVVFVNDKGNKITFETLLSGEEEVNRAEKLILSYDGEKYEIFNIDTRLHYVFKSEDETNIFKLKQIENEVRKNRIMLEYNERSHLCGLADSAGRFFKICTNTTGQITNVQYNGKTLVSYGYDNNLNLISVTDVNGKSASIFYDGHLMTKRITLGGTVFQWAYDGNDSKAKCTHNWGENGLLESWFEYGNGYTIYTNSLGYKKQFFIDDRNRLTKVINENRTTLYTYNKHNEKISVTNADGETTNFEHNELGQVINVTYPNGGIRKVEHNEQGRVIKRITPLLAETVFDYNSDGSVRSVITPNGIKVEYRYNNKGIVSTIIEGEGDNECITEFEYDKHLNLSKIKYSNGAIEQWEYDDEGNCVKNINPLGTEYTMAYDKANRLIQYISPDGNITHLKYNAYNNVVLLRDNEREISFTYTALGSMETRKERNRLIKMSYDTEERLLRVENEIGEKYLIERDAIGNIIAETGYDGIKKRYEYSPAGKVTGTTRGNNTSWIYRLYDAGGYISKIIYSNGEEELFKYGKGGELLVAENKNARLTFEYDKTGELLRETLNDHHVESQYAIGVIGRTAFQTSFGLQVDINRNKYGQTKKITAGFQENTLWESVMSYNLLGQISERTINGIIRDVWDYDPQGRPANQSVSINERESSHRKYFWDTGNKLKSIIDNISNVGVAYSYDHFGVLEKEVYEGSKVPDDHKIVIRRLGDNGNILNDEEVNNRQYGKGGQLLRLDNWNYQYDDCGDMVEKKETGGNAWQYFYHQSGLLGKVIRPDGKEISFAYDPLGRRIRKKFDGKITNYLWDIDQIIHEWIDEVNENSVAQSKPTNVFSWLYEDGTFAPIAKLTKEKAYSVISDHLGTPMTLLDKDGKSVWKANFDIYGKIRLQEGGKTEEVNCLLRFPGQYHDEETGLYYNRFRYYMPEEGIYTQTDPIGIRGKNPTLYSYVRNTALFIDPLGLVKMTNYTTMQNNTRCYGTAQVTGAGHANTINNISNQADASGKYDSIFLDRSYNTANHTTTGEYSSISRRRPDLILVDKNGNMIPIEVASQSDDLDDLFSRNQDNVVVLTYEDYDANGNLTQSGQEKLDKVLCNG